MSYWPVCTILAPRCPSFAAAPTLWPGEFETTPPPPCSTLTPGQGLAVSGGLLEEVRQTARDCQRLHSLWTLQAWPEASHHPQPFYVTPIKENGEWRAPGFLPLHNPIDINMMPFVAEADFESCRLPEFVRPYWGLILACLAPEIERSVSDLWPIRSLPSRRGAVCYLTIQESQV